MGSSSRAPFGPWKLRPPPSPRGYADQPTERQRAEAQPEVAQRDVVVRERVRRRDQQQVQDDAQQPRRHDVGEDARAEQHADTGDDLDDAGDEHERVSVPAEPAVHDRREVVVPVDQQVEELVRSCHDRRDDETDVQNLISLVGGVTADGGVRGR